ncbi:MAG: CDP-diacylglycerol--serine O-phosphatidyltransferase [Candidatus Brocadiaceae bacterium]|nr:CDP-diacylglycerol--serine O-phosphatidyltransferase [Candidatus Brocadiaceae bacterium]
MKLKSVLPNALTTGNIICGFFSIISVLNQRIELAAWFIILAMIFDAFDGRVARMLKTTSPLGIQLDSLADFLTFGIAPAFLLIQSCKQFPIAILYFIGLFFIMCAAFRLARYNAERGNGTNLPNYFFVGLPSTLSGGTIAQLVILNDFISTKVGVEIVSSLLPFVAFALASFMISKVPFFNITSKIGIKQGFLPMALEFSASIAFFVISPELALSTSLSFYLISCAMYGFIKSRKLRREAQEHYLAI